MGLMEIAVRQLYPLFVGKTVATSEHPRRSRSGAPGARQWSHGGLLHALGNIGILLVVNLENRV